MQLVLLVRLLQAPSKDLLTLMIAHLLSFLFFLVRKPVVGIFGCSYQRGLVALSLRMVLDLLLVKKIGRFIRI